MGDTEHALYELHTLHHLHVHGHEVEAAHFQHIVIVIVDLHMYVILYVTHMQLMLYTADFWVLLITIYTLSTHRQHGIVTSAHRQHS